jgi:hypothetical protein
MIRKEGYYWIRPRDWNEFVVAEWRTQNKILSGDGEWWVPGDDTPWSDFEIEVISGRLEPPQ